MPLTVRDLIIALISGVLIIFLDRGIRWRKPRVGIEGLTVAKDSLYRAKVILNAAVSSGGYLQQPWKVDGFEIQMARLEFDLKLACGAVADRKFTSHIEELCKCLQKVWVENHPAPPLAIFEGQPFPHYYLDWEITANKASSRQLAAAREGLLFEKAATERLVKLSKHS